MGQSGRHAHRGIVFILLQQVLPQHLLSRLSGWLAENRTAWLKNLLIERFAAHFDVDMSEAANPDLRSYENFNAFFTRSLRPDARPIAVESGSIVSPADGAISQLGDIEQGRIFQAKSQSFSVVELLGGDAARAEAFKDGKFATIYLSPRDYHRVHMPCAGELSAQTYIPGDLYSVNQTTAENVQRLFARNERLVCFFETATGPMAMVLVGAMIVAGIETVWSGQVAPPPRQARKIDYRELPATVTLGRGEEMGRFKLGSTVILLFPDQACRWESHLQANSLLRLGEVIATANFSDPSL
ncbi:MAG: archaetidylserine decarboxylase [Gammaproteobacteria bacterium]|nr:archaetidylserine decarboxylase [Gammaproteobacteria bacterium]